MSFAIDVVSGSVAMGTTVEGPGRGWPELGRPPHVAVCHGRFCRGVATVASAMGSATVAVAGGAAFRRSKF